MGVGGTGENMYHHQVVEQINLRAGLNVNINFSCGDVKWAPAAGSSKGKKEEIEREKKMLTIFSSVTIQ